MKAPPTNDFLFQSGQLILVLGAHEDSISGQLWRFDKTSDEKWKLIGGSVPVVIGRKGLAWSAGRFIRSSKRVKKREGDGRSPAGIFRLGTAFGVLPSEEVGLKWPYLQITSRTECVDDSKSVFYNQIVEDSENVKKDWTSSEKMIEILPQYKWGIFVEHNTPPQPQGGSCIFIHVWSRANEGTLGCTAMSEPDMISLLEWLNPDKNPVLVQCSRQDYRGLSEQYQLPEVNY